METRYFFTSDLHFGHNKEFLYVSRGFNSIEEHDETVIKNWNSVVGPDDFVFILGDLMLNDNEDGIEKINRLNGKKYIILGNHDTATRIKLYKEQIKNLEGVEYVAKIEHKKRLLWLCHYPTITANFDDGKPWVKHLINLHGHTHSKEIFYNNNPYMYNVALDAHDNTPVSFEEIMADIQLKVLEKNDEELLVDNE